MTDIGPDWVPDKDGVPHRRAARVVLFDPAGRVLLLHGRDGHDPLHSWWFTVGGGIEAGEDSRDAAVREVKEETGLTLAADALIGPVLTRSAEFHFVNVTARQDEEFYVVHLASTPGDISEARRTAPETMLLTGEGWFTQEDLERLALVDTLYPRLLPDFVRQWRAGWDGSCPHIEEK